MYEVIKGFFDLQDNGFPYNVGESFPRKGKEVSEERISNLISAKNRQKTPLIKIVEDHEEEPRAEKPKKGAKK